MTHSKLERLLSLAQKHFGCCVREAQAGGCKAEAIGCKVAPTAAEEVRNLSLPFGAEVQTRHGSKIGQRPARVHPQAEGRRFAGAFQWSQFLYSFDGTFAPLESLAVQLRVRPVFSPDAAHVAGSAGTEAVVRTAPPVV